MSNTTNKKPVSKSFAAILIVALLIISCALSCFICSATLKDDGKNEALSQAVDNAQRQLNAYESSATRTESKYSNSLFAKANAAALAYTDGADLEKIATNLQLKSIMATDDKGVVTAAFPADAVGKKLKDSKETIALNPIAKNIIPKKIGEIVPQDNGKYLIYIGASRTDLPEDKTGAIVVTLTSDEYDAAHGSEVAAECGENVIVEKDGKRVSSSFTAAGDKTIADLTKNEGKPVKVTVDGKKYDAQVVTANEHKALVAVSADSDSASFTKTYLFIALADLALMIAGVVLLFLFGNRKSE